MAKRLPEVIKLLLRHEDPGRLLAFFRALEEGFTSAFADANVKMPATPKDRPAVNARGAIRRVLMDRAFRAAAAKAGMTSTAAFTHPPTWSFPILRVGGFSVTLGIVERIQAAGPRRLRNRGQYLRRHAQNNEILNPQGNLFHDDVSGMRRVIPSGSVGALVVAEASVHKPDVPLWIGFWVPSPNLRWAYFRCSLDALLASLREQQLAAAGRVRPAAGQRKKPVLKPIQKRKPRGG